MGCSALRALVGDQYSTLIERRSHTSPPAPFLPPVRRRRPARRGGKQPRPPSLTTSPRNTNRHMPSKTYSHPPSVRRCDQVSEALEKRPEVLRKFLPLVGRHSVLRRRNSRERFCVAQQLPYLPWPHPRPRVPFAPWRSAACSASLALPCDSVLLLITGVLYASQRSTTGVREHTSSPFAPMNARSYLMTRR